MQKYATSFTSTTANSYKGYSLNKINSAKPSTKVDIIKLKCLSKSKMYSKVATRNYENPKVMED